MFETWKSAAYSLIATPCNAIVSGYNAIGTGLNKTITAHSDVESLLLKLSVYQFSGLINQYRHYFYDCL